MSENWVLACATDEIDEEDVIRFDNGDKTYCIYNTPKGLFATDGLCTHEKQHLEWGIVFGTVIECPLHQGRFDIPSGKALHSNDKKRKDVEDVPIQLAPKNKAVQDK